MVPGEVMAAVITRRVELLTPLLSRVKRGELLTQSDQVNLLGLVADAIREAEADDRRRRRLIGRIKTLRGSARGLYNSIDRFLDEAEHTGEHDDE